MNIRKSLAGIAAAALAVTGVAVATAPSANAYSGSETIRCRLYFGDAGVGSSPSSWTETISLTQAPANPNAGQTVTVTVSSTGGGNNGPVPVSANTLRLAVNVVGTGTAPASIALESSAVGVGSYPATAIAPSAALGPWSASGTYVASGNGAGQLALGRIAFDAIDTGAGNVDTYCSDSAADIDHKASPVTSTSAVQALSITGPNASVSSISGQIVTTAARTGNVITVAGTVWTPSGAITAVTVGGVAATNTLSVDGAGALSGTITVPAGATTGNTTIAITQGANSSTTALLVLGAPTLTLTPANGGPGTAIAASGSNWNPGTTPTLTLCSGAIGPCTVGPPFSNGISSVTAPAANPTGSFTGGAVTAVASLTFVQASFGAGPSALSAAQPFTLSADQCQANTADGNTGTNVATGVDFCTTAQSLSATVNPGALTQQAFDGDGAGPNTSTFIQLGAPVTTSISAQTETGAINPITVTDTRGGSAVWALTASLNSITSGANSIANSNLALGGVTCGAQPNSATGITAGSGGTFASTLTVCDASSNNADSAGGTKGGQWIAAAPLTLTGPAFQSAGTYIGTITFTLT